MLGFILFILSIAILGHDGGQRYRIWRSCQIADRLEAKAEALENHPDDPDRRILILGDSIWAGVGALDPADLMAGRLIADLPEALVVNKAESGAKIADGRRQLTEAQGEFEQPFDQIIIQLGANNIVYFSSLTTARKELQNLLEEAQVSADDVA